MRDFFLITSDSERNRYAPQQGPSRNLIIYRGLLLQTPQTQCVLNDDNIQAASSDRPKAAKIFYNL